MILHSGGIDTPVKAVLFDLDDTLVKTRIDYAALKNAMLALAAQAKVDCQGAATQDALSIVRYACAEIERSDNGDGARAAAFRDLAFDRLEQIEAQGCEDAVPISGAPEWTNALSAAHVKIGVVTRNCRRLAESLLATASIAHDVLYSRNDVAVTKPDPRHLWVALDALNTPPEQTIMVGDHWLDVMAGKAAGCLATIGVLGTHNPSWFDPAPPDLFVRDLADAHRQLGPLV
ncbi:MAG: HAD family hydrolase [Capsulimonadaceae bacterium]|nr:HAD family hydrolase [Capsulimonadaceae bacterium]